MINITLTKKEAVILAGLLGATCGMHLEDIYQEITKNLTVEEWATSDDICEEILEQIGRYIDEDEAYEEAVK